MANIPKSVWMRTLIGDLLGKFIDFKIYIYSQIFCFRTAKLSGGFFHSMYTAKNNFFSDTKIL